MLFAVAADLFSPVDRIVQRSLPSWLYVILAIGFLFVGFVGAVIVLTKTILPHWLPTYLYVRVSLFTPISRDEAEKVSFLFDGSLDGKWFPLHVLRKLEREYRNEALQRIANKIADERELRRPFTMPEDRYARREKESDSPRSASDQGGTSNTRSAPGVTYEEHVHVCLRLVGLEKKPESFEEIKAAYRRKIKEYHPDKFAGEKAEVIRYAEEMSKKLNVAYSYLKRLYQSK